MTTSKWFLEHLACPDCSQSLDSAERFLCEHCGYERPLDCIDLRPDKPRNSPLELSRTIDHAALEQILNGDLAPPPITYVGPDATRDSRELMSEMQGHLSVGDKVLDLGCGQKDQAVPVDYLGYQYVGIDYSNPKSDFIADAHAIPFTDATFDCVLSYAVLEHLHNPFIAIAEIERVLKPGGVYIGTVSQGEPFHASYFHHTSWGMISLVASVPNFEVVRIWPSNDTLRSLADMGRYPKLIRKIISWVDKLHTGLPFLAPRKMKWSEKDKNLDRLHRAGSFCFVVRKAL